MNKILGYSKLLLCIVLCVSLIGCSSTVDNSSGKTESDAKASAQSTVQAKRLSMGTAGSGGTYYVMGAAMANLINKKSDGIEMTAEVTDGSLQNISFISNGEMDIGMSGIQTTINAFEGKGDFKSPVDIRAMALIHPSVIHVIASKSSGVKKMEDMKGKKVAVGAPGSGARPNFEQILEAYGMSFADFKVYDLSYVEAVEAMKDNNMDVIWFQSGVPTSSVLDLANSLDIEFIPIFDDKRDTITAKYGHLVKSVIPKDIYKNSEDIPSIAVPNIMFCAADADEETIYQVTKCIFDNLDELSLSHEAFNLIDAKAAPTKAIPMHPGAERYFKEIGAM